MCAQQTRTLSCNNIALVKHERTLNIEHWVAAPHCYPLNLGIVIPGRELKDPHFVGTIIFLPTTAGSLQYFQPSRNLYSKVFSFLLWEILSDFVQVL